MKIVKETRIKFEKGVPLRLEGNDRDYLASWYPFFSFLVQYRSTGWRRRTEQQKDGYRELTVVVVGGGADEMMCEGAVVSS